MSTAAAVRKPTQANFVGKDALTKIQSEGVRQKIMGAEIDGIPIGVNEHHWPVSALENVATPKLESDISNVPWANLRVAYILQVSKKI
jgi:glycine cleavage system aminomethyltransferase T